MPKALMKLHRANITAANYPAVDFHFHGRALRAPDDYANALRHLLAALATVEARLRGR
ncbi:MAG: hypothetical protein R2729_05005 [Bryobacteraceae bacterium]